MLHVEVQRLKELDLESDKVSKIRDNCHTAYSKFILAYGKSREADKIINGIEQAISKNISKEAILEMKHEAETLLSESNKLLKQADALKESCHGKMEEMEKPQNR